MSVSHQLKSTAEELSGTKFPRSIYSGYDKLSDTQLQRIKYTSIKHLTQKPCKLGTTALGIADLDQRILPRKPLVCHELTGDEELKTCHRIYSTSWTRYVSWKVRDVGFMDEFVAMVMLSPAPNDTLIKSRTQKQRDNLVRPFQPGNRLYTVGLSVRGTSVINHWQYDEPDPFVQRIQADRNEKYKKCGCKACTNHYENHFVRTTPPITWSAINTTEAWKSNRQHLW